MFNLRDDATQRRTRYGRVEADYTVQYGEPPPKGSVPVLHGVQMTDVKKIGNNRIPLDFRYRRAHPSLPETTGLLWIFQ